MHRGNVLDKEREYARVMYCVSYTTGCDTLLTAES